MTPEELEILDALEGGEEREFKSVTAMRLKEHGFLYLAAPDRYTLTRAGHEVLALRRKLAEVEKDLDIAQSGKVFYHGEWDRKVTELRECATERDQLRAALEAVEAECGAWLNTPRGRRIRAILEGE